MTNDSGQNPHGAHLVGSVPLADSAAVFTQSSELLGKHLRRIPDGETGTRSHWIGWQQAVFESTRGLEVSDENQVPPQFSLSDDFRGEDIVFDQLGYAEAAIASYDVFAQLKEVEVIARECRFQVSLPTPLAPVQLYIEKESRAEVEPAYHLRMLQELQGILDAIPHDQLSIQWDTAVEFGVLEGVFPAYFENQETEILDRLVQLGNAVPVGVEMGFHLCYGDSGHKHFVEPVDTRCLVTVANGIANGIDRSLDWIHLPVPRNRDDTEYFQPLRNLSLQADTELFLGLIHSSDGNEGAQRRIRAAKSAVSHFGVATECGFGRRSPDTVPELMKLHAVSSDPIGPQ